MIKKYLLFALIGTAVMLSSCKKESNDSPDNSPFDAEYNEASVDDNKATVENNGVEFAEAMDDMKDLDAIRIAINFGGMMAEDNLMFESTAMNKGMAPITILSSIGKKTANSERISDGLKSVSVEPSNLSEEWEQVVGTYEYNFITKVFDKTNEGGNEVIINFPGLESDITNTAQIKVNDFDYFEITEAIYSKEEKDISLIGQQLPTSLHTELSYEGDVLVTWNFSASYENNGMPTSYNSVLAVEPYSFTITLTHDPYSKATSKYSFKNGSKILLETYAEMNGDWSEGNIEDNVETITETGEYYTYEQTTVYFENILKNANAYFQILNIKIAGKVNFNALIPQVRVIEDQEDEGTITEKEFAEAMVELINDNAQLVVVSADDNKMIAKVEVYTYYNDEYDSWDPSVKFIFGDGSSIDADTYVANGDYQEDFGGLMDEINSMINEFNTDYDTDIPNVE